METITELCDYEPVGIELTRTLYQEIDIISTFEMHACYSPMQLCEHIKIVMLRSIATTTN